MQITYTKVVIEAEGSLRSTGQASLPIKMSRQQQTNSDMQYNYIDSIIIIVNSLVKSLQKASFFE